MPATFAILGSGGWGTAVAVHLAQRPDHSVRIWSAHPEVARQIRDARENVRLLPGVRVPDSVLLTADPREATDGADCWVTAIPTAFLRDTLGRFAGVGGSAPVISLTKGIEAATFRRPSEVIAEVLGAGREVAVLSGPSHAEEVARGMPTSLAVAAADLNLAVWVQQRFGTERFRVYTNGDLAGVELAGALKNVVGIAAGVCDGLGYGDNAKAALLTRGLVEMTRFGVAHGAEPATLTGLAGIGDLMTTCFSPHGRNRRVGYRLGRGEALADVLAGPQVAEGVYTSKSVHDRVTQMRLDTPIMAAVYRVLHEGQGPLAAVHELMARTQKQERV
ncbi:glycerol-3-phosphate dehydrogenase : Glycerol-3-phosphate dehydrogenase [NAD(P)+] OS=Planctomyces maris DSM 8797 GN=gpsA PE=3 SV=1: NAD_Gly3P_dh_N: NAD_Gly3P_dh_C [Gemmataceae bacterium]|nr:glycerol-3-phosphate dehydrogenase : Glycerol-3-phosphate dehydrogenase [NAD(P)+] OS=Planctomyces maris DSM 8797 GN=gpsA PE=3 SV=1: NAD_Gly3P_dh_N: NAD_Gly3P_dh_C [Gemmataceae bacterium]VTT97422.1 glycerol-3-phosphate dehydrogenase : Glycerol-3-phosphate dehydrogenase [NAD(P)+] OS=Planctomyces maris DSM 8797 GN=gpsA PE=3 SV=1: NAD_Gly3P_dh_N: NAD_Gly3P_dh_C [Gemmataceae bacterium]